MLFVNLPKSRQFLFINSYISVCKQRYILKKYYCMQNHLQLIVARFNDYSYIKSWFFFKIKPALIIKITFALNTHKMAGKCILGCGDPPGILGQFRQVSYQLVQKYREHFQVAIELPFHSFIYLFKNAVLQKNPLNYFPLFI